MKIGATMRKILPLLAILLLAGCLATENRKVKITSRGIAPTTSNTVWWRTPYRTDRPIDNAWDKNIPEEDIPESQRKKDALDSELEFFEKNAVKWPKTMPPAYNPPPVWTTPAPKADSDIKKRLKEPVLPKDGEVY
jgi:hypothetical protein